MKTEINLRTREFAITREFYLPRLLTTLAAVLILALFLGGSVFVYLYRMQLEVEHNYLTQEKASLQANVAPIEEMELKTADLKKREKLAAELSKELVPWSARFWAIKRTADENSLTVTSLAAPGGGRIQVVGSSPSMRHTSLFMQALAANEENSGASYSYINYAGEGTYRYEIEVVLAAGGDQ